MRPALLNPLFAEAGALKGVGPTLVRQLARLKLTRAIDLVFHLPVMAIERVRLAALDEAYVDRTITITVTPVSYESGGARAPFRVQCVDAVNMYIALVYFGQGGGYARKLLPVGEARVISGKLDRYGQWLQMAHPDFVVAPEAANTIPPREPVYGLTEGVTNRRMASFVETALERAPELPEWIEPSVLTRTRWTPWRAALAAAHALRDDSSAHDRLAYDELLANQLALLLVRASTRRRRGRALPGTGALTGALVAQLPWPLTGAQRRSIEEIRGDLEQSAPMLRLLQGDVGAGKTMVALAAMLTAVESGSQAAFLAPTEILARQHHAKLTELLGDLPVRVAILTGRDKGRERAALLERLATGDIDILIGTHAIFQEAVAYRDLGLVVVDEQHKFGVHQRLMLSAKADTPPHLLVMTATPIPRTLALTAYGEMDVSKLDELPPGRQPIDTRVVAANRIEDVVAGLARHVEAGGQAYWVCPLVEGTETGDEAAATTRAAMLRARFGDTVGLVHGRMKGQEKDAVMADFAADRIKLLVATTVIEVGVDVPNATLMIVEAAERFGLAQLHQLRGRVGRGSAKSVCLLLRGDVVSETAKARLALMRETNDGFRIAEEDLKLRGAGEILGTKQSGDAAFRLADPERTARLIGIARDDARLLLDRDGGLDSPRGQAARVLLYLFERDAAVGLLRSG
ncbi:ATP-dependent DNA helicase RecG [Polymorphobacter sp. PAMC 29334]|uniref:ATP-dependent DNA helicase RecG n=1 Tax=Polymorphobacter sp. PAMC 29334 TaxID=2862331 RepID=UPI001C763198|nr:ATP-dependent DNA helicase RecG [Polymorphobacter sp. PAMC 29334]QYE34779.1 ATP-dependent DNA helicase RecG [Polymorphobacter sp. PAMC 29334]